MTSGIKNWKMVKFELSGYVWTANERFEDFPTKLSLSTVISVLSFLFYYCSILKWVWKGFQP